MTSETGDRPSAGEVTVPIEPTPEMMIAGADAILPTVRGTNIWPENSLIDTARRCYRAMLANIPAEGGPSNSPTRNMKDDE